MKIQRLMQVMLVSGSVCAALPVLAAPASIAQNPAPLCGDEKGEKDEDEEDKEGETRLCGDSDDDDKDDKEEDEGETRQL